MRDVILEASVGQDVLLLARRGGFSRLPRALQVPARAQMMLPRLVTMPDAMRQLRMYCADACARSVANLPDHDVLRIVERQIDTGELQAIVLPRPIPEKATTQDKAGSTAQITQAGRSRLPMQSATISAALRPPQGVPNTAPIPPRPVAQWPIEDRVAEVIRRAVPKVPGDVGATLLSLLSPESLAIVVGTIAFSAAANLTPYGWAADAVIVGLAFGFGGLAAVHALGDLVICFRLTVAAKSIQDLDQAADALARAVVGLGTVGLMAILHRIAVRRNAKGAGGGGSSGAASEGSAPRRASPPAPRRDTEAASEQPSAAKDEVKSAPQPGEAASKPTEDDAKVTEEVDAAATPSVQAYPDGSFRTPDGKFASVSGMPAPGAASADRFAEFLSSNGVDVVGRELEVDGPLGVRRYDIVTRNPDGTLHGIEVKSGTATRSRYQDFSDMFINRYGATGRGRISGQRVTGMSVVYLPGGY